ncbi:MAG: dephospho-CoA kinase [Treponema sp.]|nr:dephospho-CoA kinase [Treponema sp.]
MLIGLTGMYCAGKNHVAALLEKRGLAVLDVDKLGHTALENKKAAVCARFGADLLNGDGSVNRRLLGERVFKHRNELAALEAIVHPEANRLSLEWIAAREGQPCVINAALLHKSAVFNRLDALILVSAPWPVRLIRAKRRDKLPWSALLQRFANQKQFAAQYLAGNADIYKVENSGTNRTKLEQRIEVILSGIGFPNKTA